MNKLEQVITFHNDLFRDPKGQALEANSALFSGWGCHDATGIKVGAAVFSRKLLRDHLGEAYIDTPTGQT